MNRFKVGDRVKITPSGRENWRWNRFGKGVGVVTNTWEDGGGRHPYEVKWDGGMRNSYLDSYLDFENPVLENI